MDRNEKRCVLVFGRAGKMCWRNKTVRCYAGLETNRALLGRRTNLGQSSSPKMTAFGNSTTSKSHLLKDGALEDAVQMEIAALAFNRDQSAHTRPAFFLAHWGARKGFNDARPTHKS